VVDPTVAYQMDTTITELVQRLPPVEAAAIENTVWWYTDQPTVADLATFPPTSVILGLYTSGREYTREELLSPGLPPPTILLFTDNIRRARRSVRDVVYHEAGHRLGYHHDSAATIPCGTEATALPDVVRAVASLPVTAPISCYC
jgi:hypothetical protein